MRSLQATLSNLPVQHMLAGHLPLRESAMLRLLLASGNPHTCIEAKLLGKLLYFGVRFGWLGAEQGIFTSWSCSAQPGLLYKHCSNMKDPLESA